MLEFISIVDDCNYDPSKCSDGGAYGFWIDFLPIEVPVGLDGINKETMFEVVHGTTSIFSWCKYCGTFTESCDCTEYRVLNKHNVVQLINRYIKSQDWTINITIS